MRISQSTFSLTKPTRNWAGGMGLFATLAVAVVGLASTSYAGSITIAPAGLVAGDTYRLVFVSADTYTATDSNIADYNAEVSAEANSVTALQDLDITWSVIGSTESVSAITNIGADPGVPIYNLEGQLVANDATTDSDGLFFGPYPSHTQIAIDELGDNEAYNPVWTGTQPQGSTNPGKALGDQYIEVGFPYLAGQIGWISWGDINDVGLSYNLYAISGVLTVGSPTPEPTTIGLLALGLVFLGLRAGSLQWPSGRARVCFARFSRSVI